MNVSVVVATYNRGPLLRRLLDDLEKQSLASNRFDVTIIDDGSKELYAKKSGARLRLLSKPNPKYARKK